MTDERNPMEFCPCGKYLGHRGFCSKECHDKHYDENYKALQKSEEQLNEEILNSTDWRHIVKIIDFSKDAESPHAIFDRNIVEEALNKARQQGIEIGKQEERMKQIDDVEIIQKAHIEGIEKGRDEERKKIIDYIKKKMKKDRITFRTISGSVSFRRFPEQTMKDILDQLRNQDEAK